MNDSTAFASLEKSTSLGIVKLTVPVKVTGTQEHQMTTLQATLGKIDAAIMEMTGGQTATPTPTVSDTPPPKRSRPTTRPTADATERTKSTADATKPRRGRAAGRSRTRPAKEETTPERKRPARGRATRERTPRPKPAEGPIGEEAVDTWFNDIFAPLYDRYSTASDVSHATDDDFTNGMYDMVEELANGKYEELANLPKSEWATLSPVIAKAMEEQIAGGR